MPHYTSSFTLPPEILTAVLLDQLAETVECMVRVEGNATHIVWTHEEPDWAGQAAAMSACIRPHPRGATLEVDGVLLE